MSLHEVGRLLSHWTTSKPEDEVVAISGLISLDLRAILLIAGEDAADLRIKEFLLQMETLPKSISSTPCHGSAFRAFNGLPGHSPRPCPRSPARYQSGMGDCTCKGLRVAESYLALFEDQAEIFLTERSVLKPTSPWQTTMYFVHAPSKTTYLAEISGNAVDDNITSFLADGGPLLMKEELPTADNSTSAQCANVRAVEGSDFNLHPAPNAGIPGGCQLRLLYFQRREWLS